MNDPKTDGFEKIYLHKWASPARHTTYRQHTKLIIAAETITTNQCRTYSCSNSIHWSKCQVSLTLHRCTNTVKLGQNFHDRHSKESTPPNNGCFNATRKRAQIDLRRLRITQHKIPNPQWHPNEPNCQNSRRSKEPKTHNIFILFWSKHTTFSARTRNSKSRQEIINEIKMTLDTRRGKENGTCWPGTPMPPPHDTWLPKTRILKAYGATLWPETPPSTSEPNNLKDGWEKKQRQVGSDGVASKVQHGKTQSWCSDCQSLFEWDRRKEERARGCGSIQKKWTEGGEFTAASKWALLCTGSPSVKP